MKTECSGTVDFLYEKSSVFLCYLSYSVLLCYMCIQGFFLFVCFHMKFINYSNLEFQIFSEYYTMSYVHPVMGDVFIRKLLIVAFNRVCTDLKSP